VALDGPGFIQRLTLAIVQENISDVRAEYIFHGVIQLVIIYRPRPNQRTDIKSVTPYGNRVVNIDAVARCLLKQQDTFVLFSNVLLTAMKINLTLCAI